MRVLVTRPLEDSLETAARLAALGHKSLIAPLLNIRFRPGPDISLAGVQAILATSANGVRALAQRTARRDIRVFAVGKQSAEVARTKGFTDVRSANGGSAELAAAAIEWAKPQAGPLLQISGSAVAGDLAGDLEAAGFTVRREVLYEAIAIGTLPAPAENALREGTLDAVLLFSARSAAAFVAGTAKAGLRAACESLIAVAVSPAAAEPLSVMSFRNIRIPQRPNQDAMLALLTS